LKTKKSKKNFDIKLLKIEPDVFGELVPFYAGKRLRFLNDESRKVWRYNDFVIKVEDEESKYQTNAEMDFYKQLKTVDAKYFPKYIAGSRKNGIVVTTFEPMRYTGLRSKKNKEIVNSLVNKYGICDVQGDENYNWAIHRKTNSVIIFDLGCYDNS
jgi:hypothetical protein